MSKMHHDDSSDLKAVAEVLKRLYGVRDSRLLNSTPSNRLGADMDDSVAD